MVTGVRVPEILLKSLPRVVVNAADAYERLALISEYDQAGGVHVSRTIFLR